MSQILSQERLSQVDLEVLNRVRNMPRSNKVKKLSFEILDNINKTTYKRLEIMQALQSIEEAMVGVCGNIKSL